jgi:hypothetical protein
MYEVWGNSLLSRFSQAVAAEPAPRPAAAPQAPRAAAAEPAPKAEKRKKAKPAEPAPRAAAAPKEEMWGGIFDWIEEMGRREFPF